MSQPTDGALEGPDTSLFAVADSAVDEGISSFAYPATPTISAPAPRRRGRTIAAVVGSAAAVALIGGGAFAAAQFLSGGGTQPEDVLPSNTAVFAKIDFDPSAGQKIAAFHLLSKFPALKNGASEDSFKDAALEPVFANGDLGLSYDQDVKPWIGDRIAVALVPVPESSDGFAPVVAAAYTDEALMRQSLTKAAASGIVAQSMHEIGYAVRDGYVLISDSQADAELIAADTTSLSTEPGFSSDKDALHGDQIALGWVDVSATADLLPAEYRAGTWIGSTKDGPATPSGRLVIGAHAYDDALEITGVSRALKFTGAQPTLGVAPGTGLLESMPPDAVAAFSATGLGDFFASVWDDEIVADTLGFGDLTANAANLGLSMPGDLIAVYGTEMAAAVTPGDEVNVTVRANTADPGRAKQVMNILRANLNLPGVMVDADGGYVIASDRDAAEQVKARRDGLATMPTFIRAVADPTAGLVMYVDLGALLDQYASANDRSAWAAISAVGLSGGGGENGKFTVRLTTR